MRPPEYGKSDLLRDLSAAIKLHETGLPHKTAPPSGPWQKQPSFQCLNCGYYGIVHKSCCWAHLRTTKWNTIPTVTRLLHLDSCMIYVFLHSILFVSPFERKKSNIWQKSCINHWQQVCCISKQKCGLALVVGFAGASGIDLASEKAHFVVIKINCGCFFKHLFTRTNNCLRNIYWVWSCFSSVVFLKQKKNTFTPFRIEKYCGVVSSCSSCVRHRFCCSVYLFACWINNLRVTKLVDWSMVDLWLLLTSIAAMISYNFSMRSQKYLKIIIKIIVRCDCAESAVANCVLGFHSALRPNNRQQNLKNWMPTICGMMVTVSEVTWLHYVKGKMRLCTVHCFDYLSLRELLVHGVHVWSLVTDNETLIICNVCMLLFFCLGWTHGSLWVNQSWYLFLISHVNVC